MLRWRRFGVVVFFSFLPGGWGAYEVEARPFRIAMIPNGFVNRCANCHVDRRGEGPRNAFGQAVEQRVAPNDRQPFWNPELAVLDSDGDGFTNGEELGDPKGTGEGFAASDTTSFFGGQSQISNPGDPNSRPQGQQPPEGATPDLDSSGTVGFPDFLLFVAAFGKSSGDPDFNSTADLDGSGDIGFPDFLLFSAAFGQPAKPALAKPMGRLVHEKDGWR